MIGAKYIRDIDNGEILEISKTGLNSRPKVNERPCIFESIYFSRPDSKIKGKTVYMHRKN